MNTGVSRSKIFGVGEYPSGTFRFKKIDGSFWNGETFRFADYNCEEVLRLIEQGKIDTTPLITHRFPLDRIEEAYRIFENKEDGVIKIAVYN